MALGKAKRDQDMFNENGPQFSAPRTQPLEVMIVGLSRTGTTSMLEAMKILGYGNIYSSRDMMRRQQSGFCATLLETRLTGSRSPRTLEQFESLFGEYRCISGEPVACLAEDIIKAYPEAKVILTVRDDEEKWLTSLLDTLWYNYSTWTHWFLRQFDRHWSGQARITNVLWKQFYWGDPAAHGIRVYREHIGMVKRVVEPSSRLLIYNTKQGWGPLCAFLEKDVPKSGFPWVNTMEEHRTIFGNGRSKRLRAWLARAMLKGLLPVVVLAMLVCRPRVRDLMARLIGR